MALHDYRPEANLAIANAVGFKARIFDFAAEGRRCVYENVRGGESVFEPYDDLNAAFEAAEEVDLFMRFDLSKTRLYWQVFEFQSATKYGEPRDEMFVSAPTAADAICAAILKLKGAV